MADHNAADTYRRKRSRRTPGDVINGVAGVVARLAALVFLLAMAFTLFEVFGGGLKGYPSGFTAESAARLIQNSQTAATALAVSSLLLAVCGLILLWGWSYAIPISLVIGALLYIGLPYFGIPLISRAAMDAIGASHPGAIVVQAWRTSGMLFFATGAVMFLAWAWEELQLSLTTSRRAGRGLKVPFYSSCWQMQYCKPEIRHLCAPGRAGFRKSCWRHKSGCFCDESIGDRMLDSARRGAGPAGQAFFGPRAKAPAPVFADRFRSTHHRVEGQKIACAECPIYNYHEIQKHRILSPVALLGIPALMIYYGDALRDRYAGFVQALDRFTLHLGFSATGTETLTRQIHGAFGEPVVEFLIYILLFVLLITLAARVLEWWCFEAKI